MCQIGGSSEVWRERIVKRSRNEYQCRECHKSIPLHSSYVDVFALSDGSPSSLRLHQACSDLNEFVRDQVCEDPDLRYRFIPVGGLVEEIEELCSNKWHLLPGEDKDLTAMGFDVTETGVGPMGNPGQVCAWLYFLIRDHYPEFQKST